MGASYLVVGLLLAACSLPDVTFTRLTADAGADGAGAALRMVTATWSFKHLASGATLSCPHSTDVARVQYQPWGGAAQQPTGTLAFTDVACAAGTGAIMVPADVFRMSVSIRSAAGQVLANSNIEVIDTARGKDLLEAKLFDDAGYLSLSWDVVNRSTMARISCATAGIKPSDAIEMIESDATNPGGFTSDAFLCDNHFGAAGPLPAGHYTLSIGAVKNSSAFGDAVTIGDAQVMASDVVDLGNVKIKVPVP